MTKGPEGLSCVEVVKMLFKAQSGVLNDNIQDAKQAIAGDKDPKGILKEGLSKFGQLEQLSKRICGVVSYPANCPKLKGGECTRFRDGLQLEDLQAEARLLEGEKVPTKQVLISDPVMAAVAKLTVSKMGSGDVKIKQHESGMVEITEI